MKQFILKGGRNTSGETILEGVGRWVWEYGGGEGKYRFYILLQ